MTIQRSEAIINVTILDVNDNYPQFIDSDALARVIAIDNLTSIGIPLAQFVAIDADKGIQGKVKYKIEENLENLFIINEDTGELILNKFLPTNLTNEIHYIIIAAFDGGRPALKTTHKVIK